MKIFFLSLMILSFIVSPAFADGDHSAPATADGAAKLLEDGDFTLTPQAEKRMGIQWQKLLGDNEWRVPKEAIVQIKFTNAVYRKFEGRITLIVLESMKETGNEVLVKSADLAAGDEVAIRGTKFLRLAEVDISSGTVDNCSH
jgi:hypothetical protein